MGSVPKEKATAKALLNRLRRAHWELYATGILIGAIVASVGVVNYFIWTGTDNAIRTIIAQSLEADMTAGLLALGVFLVLQELWRRAKEPTPPGPVVGVVVREPNGTLAVRMKEERQQEAPKT